MLFLKTEPHGVLELELLMHVSHIWNTAVQSSFVTFNNHKNNKTFHCCPPVDVKNGVTSCVSNNPDDGDGCYVGGVKRGHSMKMSPMSSSTQSMTDRPRSNASEAKLEAKKRVIRMLVVIVVLFFLCWMPLYCANTWRAFDNISAERTLSGTPIAFIHLLCYTSACVNPIIYCFMNMRFRKALLSTFLRCFARCCPRCLHREPRDIEEDVMATGTSMARFSYTIVSTMGTSWKQFLQQQYTHILCL